jgi:hypothetical protein
MRVRVSLDFDILIESFISLYCTDYMWLPNDGSDAPKIPSGKGKRLIVLHACTRSEGLIDGCVLSFFPKAAYMSSLTSFNRKVVLFLATKPLTCAHINSIGLSSQCRTGVLNKNVWSKLKKNTAKKTVHIEVS